jgi:hypothetical protein
MLDYIPAQFITYGLLIPICLGQEPLHSMWTAFTEFFGQLPAIFSLDRSQQGT